MSFQVFGVLFDASAALHLFPAAPVFLKELKFRLPSFAGSQEGMDTFILVNGERFKFRFYRIENRRSQTCRSERS